MNNWNMNTKASKRFDYRHIILAELERRKNRNPSYSTRAFSRDLNLTPSRLGEILRGKVGLSEERALSIAEKLRLSNMEKLLFIDLVRSEHSRSPVLRLSAQRRVQERLQNSNNVEVGNFSAMSDWYTLALIQLMNNENTEQSVESYSKRLGITQSQIEASLKKISELEYSHRQGASWVPHESLTNGNAQSEAIKKCHTQLLDKAKRALKTDSEEKREFSSVVFTLNENQMSYAKERIEVFQRSLLKDLEEISGKDSVYCLSIQLFELTEKK